MFYWVWMSLVMQLFIIVNVIIVILTQCLGRKSK